MHTNINFAPGEQKVTEEAFSPSVVLFWLKTYLGASSTRIVVKETNTLFGIIPLGSKDAAFPLSNTASVGVDMKVNIFKGIVGVILFFSSFSLFDGAWFLAFIMLLLGVSMTLTAASSKITIQNNGGGIAEFKVSILEKAKLESFRNEINERLFADHNKIRHDENMSVQNQQLHVQQQQLNAQIMQQNAALQQNTNDPETGK